MTSTWLQALLQRERAKTRRLRRRQQGEVGTTLTAFSFFNALQIVSYIPQIVAVARDRNGATAISYSSWAVWMGGSAMTTAYALINIWDIWLALVNGVHTVSVVWRSCC